jgi:tripartite-type tricarboxylate transporter receptor subunit TctC
MRISRAIFVLLLAVFATAAAAQGYPSKPVRIIVPFAPGGAADLLTRMVGQRLQDVWGQPVVIENRTGANGNIGMEAAAKSVPDGYTLVQVPNGNIVVNPNLFAKLPYAQKDLAPVIQIAKVENVLVIHPGVPAQSVTELVALATAQPGRLSFASPGVGSQAHLAGEFLKLRAKVELLHIAYKGVGPAINDLLGGQVSMMFAAVPSALPHIKSGKLRALGLASLQRSPVLPEVATVAEQLAAVIREESARYADLFKRANIRAE